MSQKNNPIVSLFSEQRNSGRPLRRGIIALTVLIAICVIVMGVLVYGHFNKEANEPGTAPTTSTDRETGGPGATTPGSSTPTEKQQDKPAATTADPQKPTASGGAAGSTGGASGGTASGGSTGGGTSGGSTSGGGSTGGGTSCSGTHVAGGSDASGGCWPGAGNTGVPSGAVLSAYSGPTTITTPNTTITGKLINDDLFIQASNVTIKNSRINGHIDSDGGGYSLTIEDSEVHASSTSSPAIGYTNLTIRRVEITGGQHSVLCSGNCTVSDSWLHDQYNAPGGSYHNNAFLSNGGSSMTLEHNTLDCTPEDNNTGGGCTADATFLGDFAPITNVTVNNNLFVATPSGGYCGTFGYNPGKTYGSNPTNVDITNNIFQRGPNNKCGVFGPATSFLAANGNTWSNNKYTDGAAVNP